MSDRTVCIKECPRSPSDEIECRPNTDIINCNDLNVYDSYGFVSRICIPSASELTEKVKSEVHIDYVNESIEDIGNAWPSYIVVFFITLVICFIFFYLIRFCSGIVIWLFIILALVGIILAGVFTWIKHTNLKDDKANSESADRFKTISIILWVVGGVMVLLTICLCNQIGIAIKMIQSAAEFVNDRRAVLFVPIIHTFLLLIFCVFWLISFLYVFSIGDVRYDQGELFGDMVWETRTKWFIAAMVFGGLWCVSFTLSTNIFVISAMAASWYFDT